jgi:hypothetical protein
MRDLRGTQTYVSDAPRSRYAHAIRDSCDSKKGDISNEVRKGTFLLSFDTIRAIR